MSIIQRSVSAFFFLTRCLSSLACWIPEEFYFRDYKTLCNRSCCWDIRIFRYFSDDKHVRQAKIPPSLHFNSWILVIVIVWGREFFWIYLWLCLCLGDFAAERANRVLIVIFEGPMWLFELKVVVWSFWNEGLGKAQNLICMSLDFFCILCNFDIFRANLTLIKLFVPFKIKWTRNALKI